MTLCIRPHSRKQLILCSAGGTTLLLTRKEFVLGGNRSCNVRDRECIRKISLRKKLVCVFYCACGTCVLVRFYRFVNFFKECQDLFLNQRRVVF